MRRIGEKAGQHAAWALISCLGAGSVAALLVLLTDLDGPHETLELEWWMLAVGFFAAETWVVHLHFRSEAGSFSLYEVPLVLGLIFTDPALLWVAIVTGAGLALLLVRKQPGIKVAFNVANLSLHVVVATVIVDAFSVGDVLEPTTWAVLGVSTMLGGALQILLLALIITVTEGTINRPQLASMVLIGAVISAANTALALVAAILIETEPWSLLLLAVTVAVLLIAYRAYVAERTQRERVEFLYSSTKALRENSETTAAAAALLDEATSMFRAARGDLYLFARAEEPGSGALFQFAGGTTVGHPLEDDEAAAHLASLATEPVIATPGEGVWGHALGEGIRDAMVGVLHGARREIGVLVVSNRLGNVTSFTAEDLRLFETLVQHAAVALENDQLEQALGEMRRLEHDLAHQANHDTLTELANRQLFGEELAAQLGSGASVSVLYIDLDDFKVVNDSLGHDAGDHVLVEVSRRITSVIRPTDTAARLGGDEFAVVLPESTQPELVARRLIQALHDPFLIGDHDVQIGASIGVATSAPGHTDPSVLLNDADVAMYAAKSAGKGSVVTFETSMKEQVSKQRRIRTQLRQAIDLDEFEVAYQPIVDLQSGRVAGAEALVRWHAPDGVQMPGTFIGEAERAGLIVPIDRNVLTKVVARLGDLDTATGTSPFVSVNLSARNFQQDDLIDHFARTLMNAGADPSRLVAEITETA
ncbi:MAG: diguanylate cyclase, partial [Actinomycetota bacterium]